MRNVEAVRAFDLEVSVGGIASVSCVGRAWPDAWWVAAHDGEAHDISARALTSRGRDCGMHGIRATVERPRHHVERPVRS